VIISLFIFTFLLTHVWDIYTTSKPIHSHKYSNNTSQNILIDADEIVKATEITQTPSGGVLTPWEFEALDIDARTKSAIINGMGYTTMTGIYPSRDLEGSVSHSMRM